MMKDVVDWLDEHMRTLKPLYATRLSHHQLFGETDPVGLFIPRQVIVRVVPRVFWVGRLDPSEPIEVTVDSHPEVQTIRCVWYNSVHHGGDRNETRLVDFDAASVLADPESSGALVMFAFEPAKWPEVARARVWMCETADEEDRAEDRLGPADPRFGGALWPHIFERLDKPEHAYA